jgi:hypothetical protein
MAIEKFRFVSPGVQVNEIDESVIQPQPPAIGPVVIGRTARGPAMQPVQVTNVAELERVFGPASNGVVGAADVWRTGVPTSPTLATYAARAFLANSSPVTVVRLAGVDKNGGSDEPGWTVGGNVYGLFSVNASNTGALSAVFYTNATTVIQIDSGSGSFTINNSASVTGGEFVLKVSGATSEQTYTASLEAASGSFVRKIFNTNPTRFSTSDVSSDISQNYFLGETFENTLQTGYTKVYLAQLSSSFKTFEVEAESAESGYVISDHSDNLAANAINLFKFVGLNGGASTSRDIKISIENVRASKNTNVTKYGTFDVVVRKLFEPTGAPVVLERFTGVNLDVNSGDFIAKRIGDSWREWDMANSRYVEYGSYPNRSSYIRVQMAEAANGVQADIPPEALPHGFIIKGRPSISGASVAALTGGSTYPTISLLSPGGSEINASTAKSTRFGLKSHPTNNADLVDILRQKPSAGATASDTVFSTRYIQGTATGFKTYTAGTRNSLDLLTGGYVLGFDLPMYGGSDGSDITEAEPFVNEFLLDDTVDETTSAPYRSIKAAIDIVANPEVLDMNLLVIPGLKNAALTSLMVETCKARGDAMAIIDLEGDYKYSYETNNNVAVRPSNTTDVITNLTARAIDNSYGAAYFPAVFVQSEGIFLPASIAALGAFGGTEGRSALWFAPAGFTRGGLTQANAGIGVTKTALQLTSADRDALYEVNINPIATFPSEGVVIFGQKTLQTTPSALDRVNVRRLLNFIKKQISVAATRVLFEPNVQTTWNNFKGIVEPFLFAIRSAYGLDDARVVLDSTTTTADLVDRNIMYCKILLKPTRAIEFIAIDFVVTNSGASFTE